MSLRKPDGLTPHSRCRHVAQCHPRETAQSFDRTDPSFVIGHAASRFLEDFCQKDLVFENWELPQQPGHETLQHLLKMGIKRVSLPVDQRAQWTMGHGIPCAVGAVSRTD